jgi:peroxiredoxin
MSNSNPQSLCSRTGRYLQRGNLRSVAALVAMGLVYCAIGACFLVKPAAADEALIPNNLLKLLHAPEVHRELQLTDLQRTSLEQFFQAIDGPWFRSRILPSDRQQPILKQLESQAWEWVEQNVDQQQMARLKQLMYRSEGVRMLLRSELQQPLGLERSQVNSLKSAAEAVLEAEKQLVEAVQKGKKVDDYQKAVSDAIEKERSLIPDLLTPRQRTLVTEMLGSEFDTQKLQRIYPMAPELVPAEHWVNSSPLKLADLRGKVVIVHFYAFQCHNCHANFGHYQRWHEKYRDRGVVVLGIQTPETRAESDPERVRSDAKERGLQFPILVDLANKNWDSWANTMWPTVYIVDQDGYLRHWWQGELNWQGAKGDQVIEGLVERLLAEKDAG